MKQKANESRADEQQTTDEERRPSVQETDPLDTFIKNKIKAATIDGRCPISEKMVEMFRRRALGAGENEYEHLWKTFWGADQGRLAHARTNS